MESTSIYSFHPATFLSEDVELKSLGLVEAVVQNPKSIHRYKNLFEEEKNDKIDAFRIADFLRIERFQNESQLAKYCGLYWKKNQSTNFESKRTPLIRISNQYLRYYMIEAATLLDAMKKLTARKLVRLVDALLRNHKLYTPERSVSHESYLIAFESFLSSARLIF